MAQLIGGPNRRRLLLTDIDRTRLNSMSVVVDQPRNVGDDHSMQSDLDLSTLPESASIAALINWEVGDEENPHRRASVHPALWNMVVTLLTSSCGHQHWWLKETCHSCGAEAARSRSPDDRHSPKGTDTAESDQEGGSQSSATEAPHVQSL